MQLFSRLSTCSRLARAFVLFVLIILYSVYLEYDRPLIISVCYPSSPLTTESKRLMKTKEPQKRDHRTSLLQSLGWELPDISRRQEVHYRSIAISPSRTAQRPARVGICPLSSPLPSPPLSRASSAGFSIGCSGGRGVPVSGPFYFHRRITSICRRLGARTVSSMYLLARVRTSVDRTWPLSSCSEVEVATSVRVLYFFLSLRYLVIRIWECISSSHHIEYDDIDCIPYQQKHYIYHGSPRPIMHHERHNATTRVSFRTELSVTTLLAHQA
jgi:hypothetical protein